jgi:hypothetical protein
MPSPPDSTLQNNAALAHLDPAVDLDSAIAAASATTRRFREAAEAADVEALVATLSDDVVLHSPITERIKFNGRDQVRELMYSVFATVDGTSYFADVGDARTRVMFLRAGAAGQPFEEALRVELNDQQQIREITVFVRPLPGLTGFAAALVPRVARRRGRGRALIARLLLAPLGFATRAGDRATPWFA